MPQPLKHKPKPLPISLNEVGKKISQVRKSIGLSQSELAEQIGVTREAIAAYESGRIRLSDELVIRFALSLGISSDELLGLKKKNNPDKNLSLRITRRMKELDQLPEIKKKAILKTLDDLIRANS